MKKFIKNRTRAVLSISAASLLTVAITGSVIANTPSAIDSMNPNFKDSFTATTLVTAEDYLNTADLVAQAEARAVADSKRKADAEAAAKEKVVTEEAAKVAAVAVQVEEARIAAEQKVADPVQVAVPPAPAQSNYAPKPYNPSPAPAPVRAAEPVVPAPAPVAAAGRTIHVGISGGQSTIDSCRGPVLYTPAGMNYVAEHENCGGWDRIGTLQQGMTVTMSGLVSGTYTVGGIINVAKGADSSALAPLMGASVMLQTCIPGTNMMVVVGLY